MRTLVLRTILGCLMLSCAFAHSSIAQDWDANDATFDSSIKSVVIGDRTWIGDPSPFMHTGTPRTGYTYVNTTNFQGFPPAVQVSLMVPTAVGETKAPAGGMMMFDKDQTAKMIEILKEAVNAKKRDPKKRIQIKTALQGADWALVHVTNDGKQLLQLENKTKDKTEKYQFTINATKKLIGAIQHSLKNLKADKAKKLP